MMRERFDKRDFGKVAVLMGGLSAEREISLQSGTAVYKALLDKGIDAHAVDVQKDIFQVLQQGHFDRAFIALHGRGGEDGVIQGALEVMGLPYTGSGVIGSALAMDKSRSKRIWQGEGLPTPDFVTLNRDSQWLAVIEQLELPLMVKPAHEGSSFGASKVVYANDIEPAWQNAAMYDETVLAEQWIEGREYTVPILKGEILPMIRLVTPREFYDYEAKYVANTTEYLCPSGLDAKHEKELGQLALRAFKALAATGWGRVDLMLDDKNNAWLIEANTIPGMTSHSLVPMAARQVGMDFGDLAVAILETSFKMASEQG